ADDHTFLVLDPPREEGQTEAALEETLGRYAGWKRAQRKAMRNINGKWLVPPASPPPGGGGPGQNVLFGLPCRRAGRGRRTCDPPAASVWSCPWLSHWHRLRRPRRRPRRRCGCCCWATAR